MLESEVGDFQQMLGPDVGVCRGGQQQSLSGKILKECQIERQPDSRGLKKLHGLGRRRCHEKRRGPDLDWED